MDTKYWPFEIQVLHQLSVEQESFVAFLSSAHEQQFASYMVGAEMLFGACSKERKRVGEIIRRFRRRGCQWWEVVLAEDGKQCDWKFVDSFDYAAEVVLRWLHGEEVKILGLERPPDLPGAKPKKPCRYCGQPLRSNLAKQCLECGMDWHAPTNVVKH